MIQVIAYRPGWRFMTKHTVLDAATGAAVVAAGIIAAPDESVVYVIAIALGLIRIINGLLELRARLKNGGAKPSSRKRGLDDN